MKNVDIISIYAFIEKVKSLFGACSKGRKGLHVC